MKLATSMMAAMATIAVTVTAAQNPPSGGGWRRAAQSSTPPAGQFQQIGDVRFRIPEGWNRGLDWGEGHYRSANLHHSGEGVLTMEIYPSMPKEPSLRAAFERFTREYPSSTNVNISQQSTALHATFKLNAWFYHWIAIDAGTRCVFVATASFSQELLNAHLKELTDTAASISLTAGSGASVTPAAPPAAPSAAQPTPAPSQPDLQRVGRMQFRIPTDWRRLELMGNVALSPESLSDVVGIIVFQKLPANLPADMGWSEFWNWEYNLNQTDPQAGAKREELKGPKGYEIHRLSLRQRNPDGRRTFTVYEGWKVGRRTQLLAYYGSTEEVLRRHWAEIEEFRRSVFFEFGTALSLPAAKPGPLEGFFGGKYFFSRSGRVLVAGDRALNPDTFAAWETRVADSSEAPESSGGYKVTLGAYEIAGGTIRLRLLEGMEAMPDRHILVCKKISENDCREKLEEYPFRASTGYESVIFEKKSYAREKDQSGRKLSGEFDFADVDFGPLATRAGTGRATFTADGKFSWEESLDGSMRALVPGYGPTYFGSSLKGSGQYEIRGHEIILRGKITRSGDAAMGGANSKVMGAASAESEQTILYRVFRDLGRDAEGRLRIQLGDWVYTAKGRSPQ